MTFGSPLTSVAIAMRSGLTRSVLALDFDGTLAPIVDEPRNARLLDGVPEVLASLVGQGATVVVISGRDAQTVLDLSRLADLPRLEVVGLYGAETWLSGQLASVASPPGLNVLRAQLPALVDAVSTELFIEDKRLSLVVHSRRANNPDAAIDALRAPLEAVASALGLQLHSGRRVLEVRLPGYDKGRAIRRVAERHPEAQLLFAGDDVGDLPAFAVIRELRERGRRAWSVAVRSEEVPDLSAEVDLVVDGPSGLLLLLRTIGSG